MVCPSGCCENDAGAGFLLDDGTEDIVNRGILFDGVVASGHEHHQFLVVESDRASLCRGTDPHLEFDPFIFRECLQSAAAQFAATLTRHVRKMLVDADGRYDLTGRQVATCAFVLAQIRYGAAHPCGLPMLAYGPQRVTGLETL